MKSTTTYFLVAVIVCGITEWVKNFLPDSLKEKKGFLAGLGAGIAVVGSLAAQFLYKAITPDYVLTWQSALLFTGIVVGLNQSCYTVLLSTFNSIKKKLTSNIDGTDTDAIAEEVLDKIKSELTKA